MMGVQPDDWMPAAAGREMTEQQCSECGASYAGSDDSCGARFHALLALDHSRREPWGSRHGQAFAAFALQHPETYPASLDGAWQALYRIYHLREPAERVFAVMRSRLSGPLGAIDLSGVPPRPTRRATAPAIRISDLADFAAETYPALLDDWCRASLDAWAGAILATTEDLERLKGLGNS